MAPTIPHANGTTPPTAGTLFLHDPRFVAAVHAMAVKAQTALPTCAPRLAKAVALVLTPGAIARSAGASSDTSLVVQSQQQPGQWYDVVRGTCSCTDYTMHAPTTERFVCKHVLAAWIWQRAQGEVAAKAPLPAPKPLPEVPAIVSTVVMIDGRRVEVKLCDTDDARLLARLTALLAQYPCAQPLPPPTEAAEARRCPVHHVPMHESSNERGSWWSHRLDDGTWCKGKPPQGRHR